MYRKKARELATFVLQGKVELGLQALGQEEAEALRTAYTESLSYVDELGDWWQGSNRDQQGIPLWDSGQVADSIDYKVV